MAGVSVPPCCYQHDRARSRGCLLPMPYWPPTPMGILEAKPVLKDEKRPTANVGQTRPALPSRTGVSGVYE